MNEAIATQDFSRPTKTTQLTTAARAYAVTAHAAGQTPLSIATEIGCTRQTICYHLRKHAQRAAAVQAVAS